MIRFIKMLTRYLISITPLALRKVIIFYKVPLGMYLYVRNYVDYIKQNDSNLFKIRLLDSAPNPFDRFEDGGNIPRHYFYQDLWASKKIHKTKTKIHYDIGSRLDGFISHCLVFTNVVMIDIRNISYQIDGLEFMQANATNMSKIKTSSINSISSLHAVEHFGLGRYGDPVDPDAYLKVIKEIQRIANDDIYFSVPIGVEKLIFDSHRIFDPLHIVRLFDECTLKDFSAIDDDNVLHNDMEPTQCREYNYGCGLFHFKKMK